MMDENEKLLREWVASFCADGRRRWIGEHYAAALLAALDVCEAAEEVMSCRRFRRTRYHPRRLNNALAAYRKALEEV